MGCINSKNAVAGAPSSSPSSPLDHVLVEALPPVSSVAGSKGHSLVLDHKASSILAEENKKKFKKNSSRKSSGSFSFRLGFSRRHVEAEHNAAGWPSWLTAAAGEAVQGWIPLRADTFQKLDKVLLLFFFFLSPL